MKQWHDVKEDLRFYGALLTCIGRNHDDRDDKFPHHLWILGHRGARSLAPENTLSSFCLAMEHGADGVEFDVMPSRDGIPMVIHDETLERTTNGSGFVWHYDARDLGELDATKLKPGCAKVGVPTLEETLAVLPDGALVNVELKNHGHLSKQHFVENVLRTLRTHENRLTLLISSFDSELLLIMRSLDADYLIAQLLAKREGHWRCALNNLRRLNPDALNVSPDLATTTVMVLARLLRMRVAVWTINDEDQARDLIKIGVAGIFTDNVPEMVNVLRLSKNHAD